MGKIHENSLVILAHIMHFCSYEERTDIHIPLKNGNLSRYYCRFEEGGHTCHCSAEVSIPLINTRVFGNQVIWEKGFEGNDDETYSIWYMLLMIRIS